MYNKSEANATNFMIQTTEKKITECLWPFPKYRSF